MEIWLFNANLIYGETVVEEDVVMGAAPQDSRILPAPKEYAKIVMPKITANAIFRAFM